MQKEKKWKQVTKEGERKFVCVLPNIKKVEKEKFDKEIIKNNLESKETVNNIRIDRHKGFW